MRGDGASLRGSRAIDLDTPIDRRQDGRPELVCCLLKYCSIGFCAFSFQKMDVLCVEDLSLQSLLRQRIKRIVLTASLLVELYFVAWTLVYAV